MSCKACSESISLPEKGLRSRGMQKSRHARLNIGCAKQVLLLSFRPARFVCRQRAYWARCYHPATVTLNTTASQRVEGIFSVIKKGNIVRRCASLMTVKEEVDRRADDLRPESRL